MIRSLVGSFVFSFVFVIHTYGPRQSSAPYISGDSFRAIADHLFDDTSKSLDPHKVKEGDIVFVKTDYLSEFFSEVHLNIQKPYILVTHNSDLGSPGLFANYLEDEKIIMWFGQNPTIIGHPAFTPIPIGIAIPYWTHGNVAIFNAAVYKPRPKSSKKYLVGLNFRPGTHRSLRVPVYDHFSKKYYCYDISSSNHGTYLTNINEANFILSPEGNGIDTHRTWESLLMGSIPIVTHSMLDPLFEDLPVLIINDWKEVTLAYLTQKYQELRAGSYRMEKIWFDYWKHLICSYKRVHNNIPKEKK